jgi:AAA domain
MSGVCGVCGTADAELAAYRDRAPVCESCYAAIAADGRVVLTPASAITPERVRWLWRRRLPLRGLSLIAGEPGLGKSTLAVELAALVTRGRLDGDLHGEPRDVLVATAEDHFASVVWGRLVAAGADLDRVHRVHVDNGHGEELLTLPDDVAGIEAGCVDLLLKKRRVGLVVVDPVAAFIGARIDTHRDASVRRVLAPLAGLAERQRLTVAGIAHLNKDAAAKLLSRVGGSVAFGAAPRSVLAFARHPDDPGGERGLERVIGHAKSNHGRYAPSLAARIEGHEVAEVGSVSRLVITGECDVAPKTSAVARSGPSETGRRSSCSPSWRTDHGPRRRSGSRPLTPVSRGARSSALRRGFGSNHASSAQPAAGFGSSPPKTANPKTATP